MEEQVRNIISKYIRVPAEQIGSQTVIDRSAVASSIILHRMYAQLASEGFTVENYAVIKTYGQLFAAFNSTGSAAVLQPAIVASSSVSDNAAQTTGIGIDIESISAMPVVSNFRDDAFYQMNFAPAEIAYCILQTNPYNSFAGLFAAKEAIIKADNAYKHYVFNTIVIDHLPQSQPVHPGFQISISHSNDTAVAVAVKNNPVAAVSSSTINAAYGNPTLIRFTALTALLLCLLSLLLLVVKSC